MCRSFLRFLFNASLVISFTLLVHAQYLVDKDNILKDKGLDGHSFQNQTVQTIVECFVACLKDCLCITFQICNKIYCQLLSSNQFQTPSALKPLPGCSYYDMLPIQQDSPTQLVPCSQSVGWSCCKDSNPCQNGGTCEPAFPTNHSTRFRCTCAPGYNGERCEHAVKSCRGYINGSRVAGKYKVLDAQWKLFDVFCDFDNISTMAWTLIQSFQLQNNLQFIGAPFTINNPISEDTPVWDSYSLSQSRMASIGNDSSKWRITCQYDTEGIVYTDYLRAAIEKINILTYEGKGACVEMEYIDVRGNKCSNNCTSNIYQINNHENSQHLHMDSYHGVHCGFIAANSSECGGEGEDNFGYYGCTNPAHRCTATQTSTTQTWFGGY